MLLFPRIVIKIFIMENNAASRIIKSRCTEKEVKMFPAIGFHVAVGTDFIKS